MDMAFIILAAKARRKPKVKPGKKPRAVALRNAKDTHESRMEKIATIESSVAKDDALAIVAKLTAMSAPPRNAELSNISRWREEGVERIVSGR
jgi:ribosomal protein L7/L12